MTPFICRVGIKKLFVHSVLVLMALSMAPSNFVKGPIRTKAAKFLLILYFFEAVPIIVQVNRF